MSQDRDRDSEERERTGLESPGNLMASVATGKKQNTTRQLPHFIVIRHPHFVVVFLFVF